VVVGTGSGSGQTIDLSVPGTAMFGTGAASVVSTLSTAVAALQTGTPTTAQLTTALTALDANITTATQASAVLGTTAQQATAVSASLTTQLQAVTTSRSDLQDVNIATVTTQLDTQMTNYQAAMWAASQAIPESLVHFL
jgi:flagellar hook-associated protein 3 FlgL